uniref:Nuclear receptor domain-containing protein n=1 Tax=Macrostomum lignano TaxID=282301 RepID=A0A1I8FLV2_9PLAT
MSLRRHKQQQLHSDQSEVCELDDEDNYDDLTTVDDYVDDKRGVEALQEGGSATAFCQDAASGVHYGVPACEGCKGFFRRIVSSRNIGGACAHSVPLEMTPQTRNTCQWCRLKKCCAVNMGRQRSKLGRRAKLRLRGSSSSARAAAAGAAPSDDQIMLPGCQSAATQLSDITDQHTFWTILIRNDASSNLRRSCFRREPVVKNATAAAAAAATAPSLLEGRLSGRQVASQLMQQGAGSGGVGPLNTYPSPPEPVTPPTPPHWQQTPASVNCLKLISRQGTGWRSSMPDAAHLRRRWFAGFGLRPCNAGHGKSAQEGWLEKSCLMATPPLSMICRRLAGPQRAAELEDLHNTLSFNNSVSHLILTAIDKFVGYWEADLNSQFAGNPACGDVIAENTRHPPHSGGSSADVLLYSESHATIHVTTDWRQSAQHFFGGYIRRIRCAEPAAAAAAALRNSSDRVSVSSCSTRSPTSDKKRLIVQHKL